VTAIPIERPFARRLTLLLQRDGHYRRSPRILPLFGDLADRQIRFGGEDVDPVPHAGGRVPLPEVRGTGPLVHNKVHADIQSALTVASVSCKKLLLGYPAGTHGSTHVQLMSARTPVQTLTDLEHEARVTAGGS